MSLTALTAGSEAELLAAAGPSLRSAVEVRTRRVAGLCLLIADFPVGESGSWLVFGEPASHPWGLPGTACAPAVIAGDFARWGAAAIQACAGPFIALDLGAPGGVRALNGIVPLFVGDEPWTIGTDAGTIQRLTGRAPQAVPPGFMASRQRGLQMAGATFPPESAPLFSWRHFAEEVEAEIGRTIGSTSRVHLPAGGVSAVTARRSAELRAIAGTNDVLWLPDLESIGDSVCLRRLRDEIAPLLWRDLARLQRRLLVPWLERPALDLASLAAAVS